MATRQELHDGRICVVREAGDTPESLWATMVKYADRRDSSGEPFYLSWLWLTPFDPKEACYNSKTTGVMMRFMEEKDPSCFSGAVYP